jgi:hypothetical protein
MAAYQLTGGSINFVILYEVITHGVSRIDWSVVRVEEILQGSPWVRLISCQDIFDAADGHVKRKSRV